MHFCNSQEKNTFEWPEMVSEVILSRFSGYFCIKKVFSEFILCLHVLTLDFI